MSEFFIVEPCVSSNGFEIKLKNKKIDLAKAEKTLSRSGNVMSGPSVLSANVFGYSLTIYGSGRIMVKSETKLSEPEVQKLAKKLFAEFEKQKVFI